MKTIVCLLIAVTTCIRLTAQMQELEQLKLNLEKLAQFKLMLSEMKSGYQTLANGYNAVSDAGKSNFNLHQNYLDGLLAVSPQLKGSPVVQRIFSNQTQLLSSFKELVTKCKSSGVFTSAELIEITSAARGIVEMASADGDLLLSVLTPGKLRMSDGERSSVITQVNQSVQKQITRLLELNDEYSKTLVLRLQQKRDIEIIKKLGKKN